MFQAYCKVHFRAYSWVCLGVSLSLGKEVLFVAERKSCKKAEHAFKFEGTTGACFIKLKGDLFSHLFVSHQFIILSELTADNDVALQIHFILVHANGLPSFLCLMRVFDMTLLMLTTYLTMV